MKKLIIVWLFLAAVVTQAMPSPNDGLAVDSVGVHLITSFEGVRLRAYKCPAGVWTIGAGHIEGVYPGQVIDAAEAARLLKKDLKRFEKHVTNAVTKRRLRQCQFNALVSFEFNCGYRIRGNLAANINNNDTEAVCDNLQKYVNAAGRRQPGLVRRRAAECVEYRRKDFEKLEEFDNE